jgi:hypothetical protein
MRTAINDNRMLQFAMLGVLSLLGGILLLKTTTGGGSKPSSTAPAAASPSASSATGPAEAGGATATTGATGLPSGSSSAPSSSAAPQVPADVVPGPGLPEGLLPAYRHGKAIVLLVRRAGGIDDRLVRRSVELLRLEPRAKVYVTKARQIARYAWLTEGVDVSVLPALVVLRPSKLTHGTPTASVSYGFRDAESVVQAVKDALYRGPTNRPYHP